MFNRVSSVVGLLGLILLSSTTADAVVTSLPETYGTTSGPCFGTTGQLGQSASVLGLQNASATASIAIAMGYGSLPTAGVNTAGSYTIAPGGLFNYSGPELNGTYIACIASAGSTPATLTVN